MKNKVQTFFFFVFVPFFFYQRISAQIDPIVVERSLNGCGGEAKIALKQAISKMEFGQYDEAGLLLEGVFAHGQPYLDYIKGVCFSHDVNRKDRAVALIKSAEAESKEIDGYHFSLAYALLVNDSVEAAWRYYDLAFREEKARKFHNPSLAKEIEQRRLNCRNILEAKSRKTFVKITPLGNPVNTSDGEYCPLITSNDQMLVFTYRGKRSSGGLQKIKGNKLLAQADYETYYEDIFSSVRVNDTTWSEPAPLENLNTAMHDACVSLNADGTELFVFRNTGVGRGDLYLSKLNGDTWSLPVLQRDLCTEEWEGSACFLPNSSLIIFSSERKGGFGGKDLYYAEKIGEDHWGNITNLGPKINSSANEDAPFVTSDGSVLFFSSDNKSSLGGYDIFRSDKEKDGDWQNPYNLGLPINSINDDQFFTVRADGKVAYFSSVVKGGGGHDIFMVEPGIPGRPVALLQVEGLVTLSGKPIASQIHVRSVKGAGAVDFNVTSNAVTGRFLTNLPRGNEYELDVRLSDSTSRIIKLNTLGIDSFVVLNVFADFDEMSLPEPVSAHSMDSIFVAHSEFVELSEVSWTAIGDIEASGLSFKVQVGASKLSNTFDFGTMIGMPKIERQVDTKGVSRFTMGNYKTYNEVNGLLKRVRQCCVKDAFIVAVYNGERKSLKEVYELLNGN